jgi:hypothetical protein
MAMTPSGLHLVIERSALDAAFRARLLDNPRRAIADAFDIELPPTMQLKFIEKEAGVDLLIVLPDLIAEDAT